MSKGHTGKSVKEWQATLGIEITYTAKESLVSMEALSNLKKYC